MCLALRRREALSHLAHDVHDRLAERGIDPEHACESWLVAIRDGTWPLERLAERRAGKPAGRGPVNLLSPGARRIPIQLPLALVIP